tara:strand:- start:4469 stop:5575 length:1107 start_codon:yes stop_codon:yes gene_type:complete
MPVRNYEPLNPGTDITNTRTFLHEVLPITGAITSGTYNDENIKNYSHGMFQSVYDYPYLSSSANHIFDLTMGYDESSVLSGSVQRVQNSKKVNLYNEFSQYLLGFTGSADTVRLFENDLLLDGTGSMKNVFIVTLSRLLTKDQIKKGSVQITLGTGSWAAPFASTRTLYDAKAKVDGTDTTNTLGGDYGVLYTGSAGTGVGLGIVFYQAGIAVLTSSCFANLGGGGRGGTDGVVLATQVDFNSGSVLSGTKPTGQSLAQSLMSSSISGNCDAVRHRLLNVQFNNTTEINSTIYFCRAPHNKFNYSSNPTYLSGSKIRVKNVASDDPVSYITTIGLYNTANELLAIAKLSEPLRKDPQNELTVRVRLDY